MNKPPRTNDDKNNDSTTTTTTTLSTPHPDDVDALLATELNNMTIQEREIVYEEVHGVDKDMVETPDLLVDSFRRMKEAIEDQVPMTQRRFYEQAKQINPTYVDSPSFWLQFLRAEYFDPYRAAIRLCRFLGGKVEFFGWDSLARPITLEQDFDPDDMEWFKLGIMQILPARDRSGRVVMADFNVQVDYPQPKKIETVIKIMVYLCCCVVEDEENQKRGAVGLFYFNIAIHTATRLLRRNSDLFDWLPLRMVAGHMCYGDPRFRILNAIIMLVVGRERRVRLRIHDGSQTECQYKLMSFGIPVKSFPVTYEGELKVANHQQWLARRIIKEMAIRDKSIFQGIDLPRNEDVLFGRGKTNREHGGNVLMRKIIAEYIPTYRAMAKKEKGGIPLKVLQRIKEGGGRFLKRETDYGWWFEVSDDAAREKISICFRTAHSTNAASSRRPIPAVGSGSRVAINEKVGGGGDDDDEERDLSEEKIDISFRTSASSPIASSNTSTADVSDSKLSLAEDATNKSTKKNLDAEEEPGPKRPRVD